MESTDNPAASPEGSFIHLLDETNARLNELENDLREIKIHKNSIPSWPLLQELGVATVQGANVPISWAVKLSEIARETDSIRLKLLKAERTTHILSNLMGPLQDNLFRTKEMSTEIEILHSLIERHSTHYIIEWETLSAVGRDRHKNRTICFFALLFLTFLTTLLHFLGQKQCIPFLSAHTSWTITIVTALASAFAVYMLYIWYSGKASQRALVTTQQRAKIALELMIPQSPSSTAVAQNKG